MLIIGHRGASALAPENTLVAFERAIADGADGIEFDVRLARDGVPVVIHDATLKRTARRTGLIASLSSSELGEIDVGTWFNLRNPAKAVNGCEKARVPTLAQVLDFFTEQPILLYIEIKCTAHEARAHAGKVAELIRQHDVYHRAVVESFALDAIREIKRIDERIRTAALFEPKLSRPFPRKRALVEQALNCGADEIALHRTLVTPRAVAEAARRNLKTVVWTADHPSWVERAFKDGIHAIITNNPARLCERRNQLLASQADLNSMSSPS
jgi:glycerophosphoryl diester phosphodiesterase